MTFSLWIHRSYIDKKLPTTSRPRVFEAKAKDFCPRGVLQVENSPQVFHLWLTASIECLVSRCLRVSRWISVSVVQCVIL